MNKIALSGWLAYAPFRVAKDELRQLGIELLDNVPDREDGLADGRYAAAPLSTYSFAAEFERFGPDFGVHSACAQPIGYGSDRIVVRKGIESVQDLYKARIGLTPQGLEINLFEHLFDFFALPRKIDYVVLPGRSHYITAFCDRAVDVVMAPQPNRSKLLALAPEAELFEGDQALPRFGLYAMLIYNRTQIDRDLLTRVCNVVALKGEELSSLSDEQLRQAEPSSFDSVDEPATEVRTTLNWPSTVESYSYIHGESGDSFKSHLREVIEFRSRRFGSAQPNLQRIEACVN